uniref:Ent-copalyl diphosphate synthase n=1 Tax=Paeonia suffruticosa TaxID=45171 RepID=A0A3G2LEC7_PAESU|nr:ent-copalyl diphosphate synthase [Paeonia suffruticosa]
MSSLSTLLLLRFPLAALSSSLPSCTQDPPPFSPRVRTFGNKYKSPRCPAVPKRHTQEFREVFQNGLPVIKWHEIVDDELEGDDAIKAHRKETISNEIKEHVDSIRVMLGSMEDGETSISAYDTAWVSLVEDVHGSGTPQFPSSLQWIANHQLPDGSWGFSKIFSAHDRIINTLACVVALKSWNIHPRKCERGMSFIKENLCKLGDESIEHMPIGFEVAFPSLLEIARSIDIEFPDDSHVLQDIYAKRNLKLTRIPKDIMHTVPTTLLHSLEGMSGLNWEKLLRLQFSDGSFLFSPSSTAFAFMQTKDENCLSYLTKIVERFNGGVPTAYPLDMFEHMWVVDRLQRLGIARYFHTEIKECVHYIHRYWIEEGICWARNSRVQDIDDTAMGFRLLRLHGHEVSPDVFEHFEKDGEFVCFRGQSSQAVTGMYNLYRASQLAFPGERILEDAKNFSFNFLREKQANNELVDKWIITKDLPGEVGYALDVPWNASLPRLEARFYIEQYGGADDVWIGKTLYRMPYVNNDIYLELAKLDYNKCQTQHQLEWNTIQEWYTKFSLGDLGITRNALLLSYFVAATNIFEPERSKERLAWAKTAILMEVVTSYFDKEGTSKEMKIAFLHEFKNNINTRDYVFNKIGRSDPNNIECGELLLGALFGALNDLSFDALLVNCRDIRHHLYYVWETWLHITLHSIEGDKHHGEAALLVHTINLSVGRWLSDDILVTHPHYQRLFELVDSVCNQIAYLQKNKVYDSGIYDTIKNRVTTPLIELYMQELAQLVLKKPLDDIDANIKQTFLGVAKSFYYIANCNSKTINFHITKVLFERVN